MKINQIITEVPLPSDWDSDAYSEHKSFASRIRYAKERAKRIGSGSSRVAFEIEYEGRPTILKIANNKKGIAQNEYEINMLGDWYLMEHNITIPLIDSDETNNDPTWLHVEKANKMTDSALKSYMNGMSKYTLSHFIEWSIGRRIWDEPPGDMTEDEAQELLESNEYLSSLMDIAGNYDIGVLDLCLPNNWGIYKGNPVLIDLGGSSEVLKKYYTRKVPGW